jgi:signal recognition particle GTPase
MMRASGRVVTNARVVSSGGASLRVHVAAATTTRWSAPAAAAAHARHFGVLTDAKDKVMGKINEGKEKDQEKKFGEQMRELLAMPKLDFQTYHRMLKEGAEKSGALGWRSKLAFGKEQKDAVQKLKTTLVICDQFLPRDLKAPTRIEMEQRQRIAVMANVDVSEVNKLLTEYMQARTLHGWLTDMEKRGMGIPTSLDNMQAMMRKYPPKRFDPKRRFNR